MTSIPLPARTPIALVEDNAALRDELVFHLQCAGYAATGLPHGAALQAHLAHQPCCLVVLDVGLPGEDGLSICATLRAQRPELGVVLLTARLSRLPVLGRSARGLQACGGALFLLLAARLAAARLDTHG